MKTIFIVKMGAENQFTHFEWAFKNKEDAMKFRDHLDKDKGASQAQSFIRELEYYESFPELIVK